MMQHMMDGGMMWGMGLGGLIALIILILAIAAFTSEFSAAPTIAIARLLTKRAPFWKRVNLRASGTGGINARVSSQRLAAHRHHAFHSLGNSGVVLCTSCGLSSPQ